MRENTEGFYSDRNMFRGTGEFMPTPDVALSVRKITRAACRNIAETAFAMAKLRRSHVTAVGKRHVLQLSDGVFIEEVERAAGAHADIAWREVDIDAISADLYTRPDSFDVIVITNMFGDILSNAAVAMSGSLGLAAALNAGEERAAANAGHGSAPDLAGKGIANPAGLMLSATMLLEWLGEKHDLNSYLHAVPIIHDAIDAALADPEVRTSDVGGNGTTESFAAAVVDRIRAEDR